MTRWLRHGVKAGNPAEQLAGVPCYIGLADSTFHSGWTVHSAHANETPNMREVMTVIYFADGTRLMEPDSTYRRADLEAFHPGQKPGELAASPLNPLLFP